MYSRWRHPPKTVSPRPYCRSRRGRNGLGSETKAEVVVGAVVVVAVAAEVVFAIVAGVVVAIVAGVVVAIAVVLGVVINYGSIVKS